MKTEVKDGEFLESRHRVFLFLFTDLRFLGVSAALWALAWIGVSWHVGDWTWFARSGSVLAIIGGLMTGRSVLRLSHEERVRFRHMNLIERFTEQELADQERDSAAMQWGVFLILFGTLVWAYGDLIG